MPTTNGYYSFLPYIRQGLAAKLTNADIYNGGTSPVGERAHFQLGLTIQKTPVSGGGPSPVTVNHSVSLNGPGDVTGINSNAIVKVFPSDWTTNFEPNYLPYIEFYDEDFPWRYTPAAAKREGTNGFKYRIRPWITLVVLKEGEFTMKPFNGILPCFALAQGISTANVFPSQEQLWAWAHVHVNDNVASGDAAVPRTTAGIQNAVTALQGILNNNPDKAVSRLISPRKLDANTGYYAFLIPTFEGGRIAGAGESGTADMLTPAWDDDTPPPNSTVFPIYKQWYFKTGGAGDFESLVRLLQPRVMDSSVGKRQMDLQRSNNPVLDDATLPVPTLGLQGVMQPTDAVEDAWALNNDYSETIRDIINSPADYIANTGTGDPIIAPPIYGCWHAAQSSVNDPGSGTPNWIQEANMDPRYRVFAGAGAEVLRRNQDKYMAIAWEQVGEVDKANRSIRLLQLATQANTALYEKHLEPLTDELVLNISAPVHGRIKGSATNKTVFKDVSDSAIPNSMLSAAFRRLTRPGGPLVSSIEFSTSTPVSTGELIADVNNGVVQPTPPVQVPAGVSLYNVWAPNQLTSGFTYSLPTNAGFLYSNPGVFTGTPAPGPNTPATQVFVGAVAGLHNIITALPGYVYNTNPALPIPTTRTTILARTNPATTTLNLAQRTLKLRDVQNNVLDLPDLNLVLAAPAIRTPMFNDLAALSPDWIMPGLNDIANNSITILQTDRKYIEAFMLGLNHAMAGELLWRGYPTDQRGTVFSYFWGYNNSMSAIATVSGNTKIADLSAYRDIEDIHRWRVTPNNPASALTALGANNARTAIGPSSEMLVLVIRGELLRKYPGAVIYLQKAQWITTTQARKIADGSDPVYPVFTANIGQDIFMLGFADHTAEEIRGGGVDDTSHPGYFVVFQERAGAIKFGADIYDPDSFQTTPATWNDISWGNITADPTDTSGFNFVDPSLAFGVTSDPDTVTWNENSASVAYALYQAPVRLNVHAEGLIPAS